jgi:23S rRNA (adenine-N6)-dimethyltransferase
LKCMKTKFDSIRKISHSQNFLKSTEFVNSLIGKTSISNNDLVVEIGPGKGIITTELAKKADKVIGIEYDRQLAINLKSKFVDHSKVEIIEADFLKWDLPKKQYKVFSNIPFNMTADIINKLLNSSDPPEAAYLLMQDKAAERFIGFPVGVNTQVSILLQPFYNMSILAHIDRSQFEPIPSVNVVLVGIEKRRNPDVDAKYRQMYRDFVIYGYNQWQPTLLDAFREVFTKKQLDIISRNLGIQGKKPSELKIQDWIKIFDTFIKFVPDERKNIVLCSEKRLQFSQKSMEKRFKTGTR